eukprot:7065883-Pyramimonas_sp.AAC.1
MDYDLGRPDRYTLPCGRWDDEEIFLFHATQGADEGNEHGGSFKSEQRAGAFTPHAIPRGKAPNLYQVLGLRPGEQLGKSFRDAC